jgi:hypothetical protein
LGAEMSCFALAEIMLAQGGTGALLASGHGPWLAILGPNLGLVVVRAARAVGGAVWKGVESEIELLGADAAAQYIDVVRRRLGIPRRPTQE